MSFLLRVWSCLAVALLVGGSPVAAQDRPAEPRDLPQWVVAADRTYLTAAAVIEEGQDTTLSQQIDELIVRLKEFGKTSEGDGSPAAEMLRVRWDRLVGLLERNLESLDTLLTNPPAAATIKTGLAPEVEALTKDTEYPLVSDVAARILELLGTPLDQLERRYHEQARVVKFMQLANGYQEYRGRILALADEVCRERHPLCESLDPERRRSYVGLAISGYESGLYGVGFFASEAWLHLGPGHRTIYGLQILNRRLVVKEFALELSGGSMFGDFAVMPGIILSPASGKFMEVSGSVMYLTRDRVALGVSFSMEQGFGIRWVVGDHPDLPLLPKLVPGQN